MFTLKLSFSAESVCNYLAFIFVLITVSGISQLTINPIGPGSCLSNGESWDSPTWESIPYSEQFGFLTTGTSCAAKVGIGISNPISRLHVGGDGFFTGNFGLGIAPNNSTTLNAFSGKQNGIYIDHKYFKNGGYALKAVVHNKNGKAIGVYNKNFGQEVFSVYANGTIQSRNENYRFFSLNNEGHLELHNANGAFFEIKPNGTMEISNATGKTLKLEANGTLRGRKIKVDQQSWPDYVFKKEYNLMPLKEVAEYIEAYGHLPNIPSESEIIDNGLDLGQMNVLLMEKIEELTLHAIEQQKVIQLMQQDIQNLEKMKCQSNH